MPSQAELDIATERAAAEALLKHQVDEMKRAIDELKADRDKFLRWGVIVLGGAVVSLVTWIFNLLTRHP